MRKTPKMSEMINKMCEMTNKMCEMTKMSEMSQSLVSRHNFETLDITFSFYNCILQYYSTFIQRSFSILTTIPAGTQNCETLHLTFLSLDIQPIPLGIGLF